MPIILPDGLPAIGALSLEGVPVLQQSLSLVDAVSPLRIALVNLMPAKTATEIQFARHLSVSDETVQLELVVPDTYSSRTTSREYIDQFYARWSEIKDEPYDGLIITGAPIEHLPFDMVRYWEDMTAVFDWARDRIPSSYYVCWAAQAALWHFHGVPKRELQRKMFGIFPHGVANHTHPLLRGLGKTISIPVSRHTTTRLADLPGSAGLDILMESELGGLGMIEDQDNNAIYMFNHLEYDAGTLGAEYRRDVRAGRAIDLPRNYFPCDDPCQMPINYWRSGSQRFYANWVRMLATKRRSTVTNMAA